MSKLVNVSFLLSVLLYLYNGVTTQSFAQITINNTYTVAQLVDGILVPTTGSGVTVSNITFSGVRNVSSRYQIGYFSTATTTLTQMGFSSGVVLSTGDTSDIPLTLGTHPGSVAQMSRNYVSCTAGEVRNGGTCPTVLNDLNVLSGGYNYYNTALLEFDFVPTGNSVSFRYVFGSEEYSDNTGAINYQCSTYNDRFGFLISGPGISGGQGYTNNAKNIARLANGSAVSINSVNNGVVGSSGGAPSSSNCLAANSGWVQNTPTPEFKGIIDGTELNGNTVVMTASQTGLTPGATYHIKLIVMDISDGAYDSVVYLEAASFTSICKKEPATGTVNNPTNVGIGTFSTVSNNWPSTIQNGFLALDSKSKGFVITRLTTAQRDLLNAQEGMVIYNTTLNCVQLYNGTTWNCIQSSCVE